MTMYVWDTNGGPVFRKEQPTPQKMQKWVEEMVPMLRRRGYTKVWSRSGHWYVMRVYNSRGRQVHNCAFRPMRGTMWERNLKEKAS